MSRPRIAILVSFSGQGGVERMVANLATAMVAMPVEVDLLLIKSQGPHLDALPPQARLIRLGTRHTATSVFPLARYLRRTQPDALLAVKHRAIIAAIRARRLARTQTPIVGRLGTTVSAALAGSSKLRREQWFNAMRRYYPQLQAVVGVSQGVIDDIADITGLRAPELRVIRNPVITADLKTLSCEPLADHPLPPDGMPVVLGAGRLTDQKDFSTLLRAFALVTRKRPARLVILGDGGQRDALLAEAGELGIASNLLMPGFQRNPWAWMSKAQVFVLSSRWEGSPNSLTEALALGIPVVSTDCPSGPNELLDGGRVGPLVPMGDSHRLAEGIEQMLDNPPAATVLQAAVHEYHAEHSARAYLHELGIDIDI